MANKPLNTELLDRAIIFAVNAHAGTERRGKGYPYIVHPNSGLADALRELDETEAYREFDSLIKQVFPK